MITEKPIKMFVYQPIYLKGDKNDKYIKSIIINFPFCRIEVGDVFTGEKRSKEYYKLDPKSESKVAAVRYNYAGHGCCVVILEKKVFKSLEDINQFVAGKGTV